MKYICKLCGWTYDERIGWEEAEIDAETPWDEVPDDFECPLCWAEKDAFTADSE